MNILPLNDNILIGLIEVEEKLPSGLILPENAKEKPQIGKVLAIGKDVSTVAINDTVVYKKWVGNQLKFENTEFILIDAKNVLAIIK